jgi:hypothetical protein
MIMWQLTTTNNQDKENNQDNDNNAEAVQYDDNNQANEEEEEEEEEEEATKDIMPTTPAKPRKKNIPIDSMADIVSRALVLKTVKQKQYQAWTLFLTPTGTPAPFQRKGKSDRAKWFYCLKCHNQTTPM